MKQQQQHIRTFNAAAHELEKVKLLSKESDQLIDRYLRASLEMCKDEKKLVYI